MNTNGLALHHRLPVEVLELVFARAAQDNIEHTKHWVSTLLTTCKAVYRTVAPILFRSVSLTAFNLAHLAQAQAITSYGSSPFSLTRELIIDSTSTLFDASSLPAATQAFTAVDHFSGTLSDFVSTVHSTTSALRPDTLVLLSHISLDRRAINSRIPPSAVQRTTHLHVALAVESDLAAQELFDIRTLEAFECVTHLILDVVITHEGALLKHALPFLKSLPRLERALLRSTDFEKEVESIQEYCDKSGESRVWCSRLMSDPLAAFYSQRKLFDHERWFAGSRISLSNSLSSDFRTVIGV